MFSPVMSIRARAPAGRVLGENVTFGAAGAEAPVGYVYVGAGAGPRNIEFCPSLLNTATTAVWPFMPGGGMAVAWELSATLVAAGRPSK